MNYNWKVVPLCEKQLKDVNPLDILSGGLYRKCNIYKGGGGYDKFSDIYKKRLGIMNKDFNNQFVVQLYGCTLNCPYCYVTRDGIFGKYQEVSTKQLIMDFKETNLDVFHLMGGAPAIYIEHWIELLENLGNIPFHSDLLCVEKEYDKSILKELSFYKNALYAVSIKGFTPDEFRYNTGVEFDSKLFWNNLSALYEYNIPFYITFTGMSEESIEKCKKQLKENFGEEILADSFAINLIKYKALED